MLFLAAAIAENKRIPFDLPEAESELIAGYYTEYSAMKMGLFMFAEFIEIAIIGALFTTLFLGGYNLPYMTDAGFVLPGGHAIAMSHGAVVVIQLVVFLAKVLLMSQLPDPGPLDAAALPLRPAAAFAWKFMFPLALANLVGDRGRRLGAATRDDDERPAHVRKQYWNEPTMAWWERAYLLEILRGLVITGGVFLRNMWQLDDAAARARSRPTTPRRRAADYAPSNRGKHVLTQRPDGRPQCIACNMCATVCPAKVIEIEAGFDPDDAAHPKYPGALRDRLFALRLLRPVRRGLPRGRDPHGEGGARPAAAPTASSMWLAHGRAAHVEPAERRRQALSAGGRRRQARIA